MSDEKTSDQDVSAIDKALQAAKARKAIKGAGTEGATTKPAKESKPAGEPKRPRLSDEDKAARLAQRETERAARKLQRDEQRAIKLAERNAGKSPAHMKKVLKAAEKLGSLGQSAELLFNEATTNLSSSELSTLAVHIQHFNRVKATERALNQKVTVGSTVNVIGGDPRYIGKSGTVSKAQRIRCYVTIPGVNKPVYLFTSDVEVQATQAQAATA